MNSPHIKNEDFDGKVKRLQDMFESIPPNTIRLHLHNCSGDFDNCVQKLLEYQKNQEESKRRTVPPPPYSSSSSQKFNLPQLHTEMNKLNEKNFSLLEQKISHQEEDISLLKDMIKARDLTIEKLQQELQELRGLREREKSSGSVVSDLASSIKSNVDSGFKSVEDPQGVDFNKLVIEVKKQLAMSFLTDFKESRIDRTSKSLSMSTIGGFVSPPPQNLGQPPIQDKPLPNLPLPANNIPYSYNLATNNLPNNIPYYPPSNTYPKYGYQPSPYYSYPSTQPSAPAYYPTTDPNQIKYH